MSELAETLGVAATPPSLGGRALTPYNLEMIAAAEQYFDSGYIRTVGMGVATLPRVIADAMIEKATLLVAQGFFHYGREGFDAKMLEYTSLPYILYITARTEDKKLTMDDARKLVPPHPKDAGPMQREVLAMWGYKANPTPGGSASPNPPRRTKSGKKPAGSPPSTKTPRT